MKWLIWIFLIQLTQVSLLSIFVVIIYLLLSIAVQDLYLLAVTEKGFGKRIAIDDFRTKRRRGAGVTAIKFKVSNKYFNQQLMI